MKNSVNLQNATNNIYRMKSLLEVLIAWLIGTVVPLLMYFQMIFWLIIADCTLGTWLAVRKREFGWLKFFGTFGKGAGLALLLIAFHEIQKALHIPSVTIGSVEFSVVMFLAGIMAAHEAESIDKKCVELWGFSFLKPLKDRFPSLKEFDNKNT
jgi:hypothetical protein